MRASAKTAAYHLSDGPLKGGTGTREHLYAGNQQSLVGEFVGTWRAWDGIRALDYLLTREEVDRRHLGVTGNSGGGTMTTWLCGVEQRWTMAAPSCFVTSFRRNLENELPADTEQCPPRALALGLDHEDFLAAMAPKFIRGHVVVLKFAHVNSRSLLAKFCDNDDTSIMIRFKGSVFNVQGCSESSESQNLEPI